MVLLMVTSTANIVVQTYQNEGLVHNSHLLPNVFKFDHPYFQTLLYQIAQVLAFLVYLIQAYQGKHYTGLDFRKVDPESDEDLQNVRTFVEQLMRDQH